MSQPLEKAQQQLLNSKNLAVQQSTEFRSDLILQFRKEVASIAQEIAKKAGSQLVIVSNYETLWFDPASDITDEIISVMRARKANKSVSQQNSTQSSSESSQPVISE